MGYSDNNRRLFVLKMVDVLFGRGLTVNGRTREPLSRTGFSEYLGNDPQSEHQFSPINDVYDFNAIIKTSTHGWKIKDGYYRYCVKTYFLSGEKTKDMYNNDVYAFRLA